MKRNSTKTKPAKSQANELSRLYEADETAWLERTAELIQTGHPDQLDYNNLAEYLLDMARRDRREVLHRLSTLMAHLLKQEHQPSMSSRSWGHTIRLQRHELQDLCESGTLRNHALEILATAYRRARDEAVAETALPESRFPTECPFTLDDLLAEE